MSETKQLGADFINYSLSCGTMQEEDLIPIFENFLKEQRIKLCNRPIEVSNLLSGKNVSDIEWEKISWYLNEDLFDLLNAIAPKNCYFGANPGDGADYGFWYIGDDDGP